MLTFPTLITGTATGMRISSVDGTAFLDNCAALVPYADGNHLVEIYDASNRMLQGYLKAQGSGETYTELVTGDNSTFASDTGFWAKSPGIVIGSNVCTFQNQLWASTSGIYKEFQTNTGCLYYSSFDIVSISGSSPGFRAIYGGSSDVLNRGTLRSSPGTYTEYKTCNSGTYMAFNATQTTMQGAIDNVIYKQVLTPSASGATIVSTKGGTTYNFAYKNTSFTYNAASYRYAIYDTLKVSRPTRYMGVSTHNI